MSRRTTVLMYGAAFFLLGVSLYVQSPTLRAHVREITDKVRNCAGCKRRREAVQRVIREAQETVGFRQDAPDV
jgi:hypothetical protein